MFINYFSIVTFYVQKHQRIDWWWFSWSHGKEFDWWTVDSLSVIRQISLEFNKIWFYGFKKEKDLPSTPRFERNHLRCSESPLVIVIIARQLPEVTCLTHSNSCILFNTALSVRIIKLSLHWNPAPYPGTICRRRLRPPLGRESIISIFNSNEFIGGPLRTCPRHRMAQGRRLRERKKRRKNRKFVMMICGLLTNYLIANFTIARERRSQVDLEQGTGDSPGLWDAGGWKLD